MSEHDETAIEDAKRALRRQLRTERAERGEGFAAERSPGLTEHLKQLTEQLGARTISAYLSMPQEPDTRPFLEWAASAGIRVLLPVIRADGLLDWAEHDGTETIEATLGIPEPTAESLPPTAVESIDLMLIPATAVGRDGSRLGGGRGFFDKTIAAMRECPPVYAVVHDEELFDSVPHAAYDQPVDGVVTQSGIHRVIPPRS
ncbi:5-formyltetrahydrofolate cyclo-ligase [Agrococcus sp. HG114]|uniref:5-formyltetrahydrofolate cyclo-ligase n=1 Tax=Agrococcus sp. HG114 TaxID=2969757 RepID=UPI00215AC1A8|nr:5-formyltetrahydrofolate cyclo-ligase [Agrococcus sp. HG114]MCR8670245.1 5-formyltetrahydrofolate cyclo-ligase [Agrococcus sp. HG114]